MNTELIAVQVDGKQMWMKGDMVEKLANGNIRVFALKSEIDLLMELFKYATPHDKFKPNRSDSYRVVNEVWVRSANEDFPVYPIPAFFAESSQAVVSETGRRELTESELLQAGQYANTVDRAFSDERQWTKAAYCAALSTLPAPSSELLAEREQMWRDIGLLRTVLEKAANEIYARVHEDALKVYEPNIACQLAEGYGIHQVCKNALKSTINYLTPQP